MHNSSISAPSGLQSGHLRQWSIRNMKCQSRIGAFRKQVWQWQSLWQSKSISNREGGEALDFPLSFLIRNGRGQRPCCIGWLEPPTTGLPTFSDTSTTINVFSHPQIHHTETRRLGWQWWLFLRVSLSSRNPVLWLFWTEPPWHTNNQLFQSCWLSIVVSLGSYNSFIARNAPPTHYSKNWMLWWSSRETN